MQSDMYPVIGMSPGNSYFKDDEVRYLLKTVVERYGRTGILIADVPAISTYIAFGYPENRARTDKAIAQGNAFKNRTRRIQQELGYAPEQVRIADWADEIEKNPDYQGKYKTIRALYDTNAKFQEAADNTTKEVLVHSGREIADMEKAVKIAVHYLLSEFAFLEFAPQFFGVPKVTYVYHKNWPVYEDYIAGKFDGVERTYLDFTLIENPYETYNPMWTYEGDTGGASVLSTKVLCAAFNVYDPALLYDPETKRFSGIFCEIITRVAKEEGWEIQWTEETGYGVIEDGLNANRFDLFASTAWPTPERLKEALFTDSLYNSYVYPWVVEGSAYESLEDLKNDSGLRISVKEGDISDSIATADFPNARLVRVPQLSPVDSILEFVADGRAEATFVEPYLANLFNKKSERRVVRVGEPVRSYGNTIMLAKDNHALKELLDAKIAAYMKEGFILELIRKYTGSQDTFG